MTDRAGGLTVERLEPCNSSGLSVSIPAPGHAARSNSRAGASASSKALPVRRMPQVTKRSVKVAGYHTSVTVELPFWLAVKMIAREKKITIRELLTDIRLARLCPNLSSAIRMYVLAHYQNLLPVKS